MVCRPEVLLLSSIPVSAGHTVLPFTKLNWAKFEAFVLETLSSKLTIELPASQKPKRAARTYRIIRAEPYGGEGHNQKGIDFICTMDEGSTWVFQAKLMSKFGLTDAKRAVKKARRNFPKAKRFVLLVSGNPNPTAIDYIRQQNNWDIWGGPSITSRFLRSIPIQCQIDIIGRVWPALAAQLVSEYYPLRDTLLVTPEEFFSDFLKPDRLFHHRSALVGYVETLDALSAFLRDPVQRAAIIVAPGGRGKSRLLRAFADRVREQHPDFTVRFVDPLAPPGAQAHALRAAGDTNFVVVQDDAHRSETLRHELIANLAKTRGKLLLATRPQAVTVLEELVVRLGFPSNQLIAPIRLPKLKLHDYEALAWAELDPPKRNHHRFLARMGRDCPLVITVGASLINRDLIPPDRFEERHFRNEVFARFEGDELNRLSSTHPRTVVREILQTIAVLAPWLEKDVPLKTVASFVNCTESDLQTALSNLEAGQLVIPTGRGRRVIPDLFADHLVYTACYNDDGTLTPYARKLAGAFATTASPNMLRNLAEADWRALQYHTAQRHASVLEPFWQSLWDQFAASDFYTRAQLIERWAAHSVYQPIRSLTLCELAYHLREAPKHPEATWCKGETGARINSYQWVLDHIPAVIEPIAIYLEDYRDRCLDLLLDLAAVWPSDRKLDDQNHPWAVIGRVATFKADHPISASQAVLAWLEKRIPDARFKPALERPSGILAKILSPVFARQFDVSYSEGNTVHFAHRPVDVRQTQPMRDHALKIIEHQIIPLGEIPTLNAIPTLNDASRDFVATFGSRPDEATKLKWEPERLKAIAVCDRIHPNASARVRWRLRTHLRHIYRGAQPESAIHKHLEKTLSALPFTGSLRDVALFCSHEWQEMDDERFGPESRPITERKDQINQRWAGAIDSFVRDYTARYPQAPKLLSALERLFIDCESVGLTPTPFAPLSGFWRHDLKLTKALVTQLLQKRTSPLHYWWTSLIAGTIRLPDPWLEATALKVLRSRSAPAVSALLSFLSTRGAESPSHAIIKALRYWSSSATEDMADVAIANLRHAQGPADRVWLSIAPLLPLRNLTAAQICALGDSVSTAIRYGEVKVPEKFFVRLVSEFTRVPDLNFNRAEEFLELASKRFPKSVFALYRRRILLASKGKFSIYTALPMDLGTLSELPKSRGYAELVSSLFKAIRSCPRKTRWAFARLIQTAVIRVSPLALPRLAAWVRSAKSMEELYTIASLLSFDGSLYLLRNPDLTIILLRRGRTLDPCRFPDWEFHLASTMGPKVHSFTNGKRDSEQDYIAAEVTKLAAAGNVAPELKSFYAAVLKHDQSWANSSWGLISENDD